MPEATEMPPSHAVRAMRGVLFDMDGVIYNDDRPIAGAVETIEWVQAQDIPHLFLTNTTSKSCAALSEKLQGLGIRAAETQILTPAAAVAKWLRTAPAGQIALFVRQAARREVAGLPGLPEDADPCLAAAAVAKWLRTAPAGQIALFVRQAARREFAGLPCLPEDAERGAAYVIVGDLGDLWDYRTLNRAFRLLHNNRDAELVALGMTRYWLASDGFSSGLAPFVAALQHATGTLGTPGTN